VSLTTHSLICLESSTIQLHLHMQTKFVDSITHLAETYSKIAPVLNGIHSYSTHHEAFFVL
jgi:hypothetical protein